MRRENKLIESQITAILDGFATSDDFVVNEFTLSYKGRAVAEIRLGYSVWTNNPMLYKVTCAKQHDLNPNENGDYYLTDEITKKLTASIKRLLTINCATVDKTERINQANDDNWTKLKPTLIENGFTEEMLTEEHTLNYKGKKFYLSGNGSYTFSNGIYHNKENEMVVTIDKLKTFLDLML